MISGKLTTPSQRCPLQLSRYRSGHKELAGAGQNIPPCFDLTRSIFSSTWYASTFLWNIQIGKTMKSLPWALAFGILAPLRRREKSVYETQKLAHTRPSLGGMWFATSVRCTKINAFFHAKLCLVIVCCAWTVASSVIPAWKWCQCQNNPPLSTTLHFSGIVHSSDSSFYLSGDGATMEMVHSSLCRTTSGLWFHIPENSEGRK